MSDHNLYDNTALTGNNQSNPPEEVVLVAVPEPAKAPQSPLEDERRRWLLPLALFVATCASTYYVGGPVYALCVMTILVCHEAGHFVQTLRYGVYSSFPYFIPIPFSPIGTLGAVIGMSAEIKNRRALFDIGISGPLAGLVPTLIFCVVGLLYGARVGPTIPPHPGKILQFGEPLFFQFLSWWRFGELPPGMTVYIGPMAMAGWVGIFITALNLFPIGQLDGGHVLYAMLRRKAHFVASFLLLAAIFLVVSYGLWVWTLMLALLMFMGPNHPPTGDDNVRLGAGRIILGWLTLAFVIIGFTPNPLQVLVAR